MVVIVAVYSKKIGLPSYSSHSYSVSLTSEVADLSQVERESAKLYSILQESVDRELENPGLVPDGNGHGSSSPRATNDHAGQSNGEQWACSEKQRVLILKIVDEHRLEKSAVESLSKEMFNQPVKALNRMNASSLIAELISKYGPTNTKSGNGNGNARRQYQRRGQ